MSDNKYAKRIASHIRDFTSDLKKKRKLTHSIEGSECKNEGCVCDILNTTLIQSNAAVIQAVIERSYEAGECSCSISLKEKVNLFYYSVIELLAVDNTEVILKFKKRVRENDPANYSEKDLLKARQMLSCPLHKSAILNQNICYFKELLQEEE